MYIVLNAQSLQATSKKSRFIKNQESSRLLSNLVLNLVLGDILV